jgi:ribosome recycling factor
MSAYKLINGTHFLEDLKERLSKVRTDRINSSILDNIEIFVPSWGEKFQIKALASINIPQPNSIVLTPFDKSHIQIIQNAIRNSDIGVNPIDDGICIKLNFPSLTTQDREKRAKQAGQFGEDVKIEVRKNRQDLIKKQDQIKEKGEISEDELNRFKTSLQKEIDLITKDVDNLISQKQKELLSM